MPDFNDIVIYSDDSYNEGSDKEYYDFNDSDEEILMKKFKQIKCIFFFRKNKKNNFIFSKNKNTVKPVQMTTSIKQPLV